MYGESTAIGRPPSEALAAGSAERAEVPLIECKHVPDVVPVGKDHE
jgi:hypothetical protein